MIAQEEIARRAKTLTDEQAETILQLFVLIQPEISSGQETYDPENDPIVGMFAGPTNFSTEYKRILQESARPYSGWTQKDDA